MTEQHAGMDEKFSISVNVTPFFAALCYLNFYMKHYLMQMLCHNM